MGGGPSQLNKMPPNLKAQIGKNIADTIAKTDEKSIPS